VDDLEESEDEFEIGLARCMTGARLSVAAAAAGSVGSQPVVSAAQGPADFTHLATEFRRMFDASGSWGPQA
jgi:hypothetical protein